MGKQAQSVSLTSKKSLHYTKLVCKDDEQQKEPARCIACVPVIKGYLNGPLCHGMPQRNDHSILCLGSMLPLCSRLCRKPQPQNLQKHKRLQTRHLFPLEFTLGMSRSLCEHSTCIHAGLKEDIGKLSSRDAGFCPLFIYILKHMADIFKVEILLYEEPPGCVTCSQ